VNYLEDNSLDGSIFSQDLSKTNSNASLSSKSYNLSDFSRTNNTSNSFSDSVKSYSKKMNLTNIPNASNKKLAKLAINKTVGDQPLTNSEKVIKTTVVQMEPDNNTDKSHVPSIALSTQFNLIIHDDIAVAANTTLTSFIPINKKCDTYSYTNSQSENQNAETTQLQQSYRIIKDSVDTKRNNNEFDTEDNSHDADLEQPEAHVNEVPLQNPTDSETIQNNPKDRDLLLSKTPLVQPKISNNKRKSIFTDPTIEETILLDKSSIIDSLNSIPTGFEIEANKGFERDEIIKKKKFVVAGLLTIIGNIETNKIKDNWKIEDLKDIVNRYTSQSKSDIIRIIYVI
jgi:hypothetical protein